MCLKGLNGAPSNTLKLFSTKCFKFFSLTIHKKCFDTKSEFFHKNMLIVKKKDIFTARSSNCSVSAKFFRMLVKTPSFGGIINPKTNLNHKLGSNFFSLSDLAYKLANLLFFEKCSCEMSKN